MEMGGEPAKAISVGKLDTEGAGTGVGRQKKKGGWITFPFIAGSMIGLTIAQIGVMSNLIVYLIRQFHVKSILATQVFSIVNGSIFAAPVAGAVIGDSWIGCFPVILVSTFVSLLGMIMFTLSAAVESLRPNPCSNSGPGRCEPASSAHYAVLYIALSLMCAGSIGSRYITATMGADQLNRAQDIGVFFNWFFSLMFASTIIGATVIVFVQDNIGWGLGFGICAAVNLVSLISLASGFKYYRYSKPNGSPLVGIVRVLVAAVRKAKVTLTCEEGVKYYSGFMEGKLAAGIQLPSQTLRFFNKAAVLDEGAKEIHPDGSVARPWRLCTVAQVEDLKDIVRLIPLWCAAIFVSVSLSTQLSLTILQALTVNRSIGHHFTVPAGSLSVASFATVAISLPVLDRIIFPLSSKLLGRYPTPLQRIGFGQVITAIGLGVSAIVERRRLDTFQNHGLSGPGGIVPISIAWLVLPLPLVGLGEALVIPGQVSLFYDEFPEGLKTVGTAMTALVVAIGFYIATALVGLFHKSTSWLPDDINTGRMDIVYWTLAAACTANFLVYLVFSKIYTYRSDREPKKLNKPEPYSAP